MEYYCYVNGKSFFVELTHCEITVEGIIMGNLKWGNYRQEDAWECSKRK